MRTIMKHGRWVPWMYLAPALIILAIFVVYPTVRTAVFSVQNDTGTGWATENCGPDEICWGILENYNDALTEAEGRVAIRNTFFWIIVMVPGTALLGLMMAVLTNRVSYEPIAKSIIFMPMAISFVGAAIIWRFVYHPDPQIGILNAFFTAVGLEPQTWLAADPPANTFLLTIIGVWIWTGFTMTILAAAIRNVPVDTIESARVDGANRFNVFRFIVLPQIAPTIAVVLTVMTINTLKMFDIVWVMKGVRTDILATRMVEELFLFRNNGLAAAYAMILIVLIIPLTVYNIRRFTLEEARK